MSKKFTFLIFFTFLLAPVFSQNTQQAQPVQVFYVQCTDIDFEKYRQLDAAVKNDGHFTISAACIPAHVLTIQVNAGSAQQLSTEAEFDIFRYLCIAADINTSELLAAFNKEMFENQCKSARSGN